MDGKYTNTIKCVRYPQITGYYTGNTTVGANNFADLVTDISIDSLPDFHSLVAVIPAYVGIRQVAVNSYVSGNRRVAFTVYNLNSADVTYNSASAMAFSILYV